MRLHRVMQECGIERLTIERGMAKALTSRGVEEYDALVVKMESPVESNGERFTTSEYGIDVKLLDCSMSDETLMNELLCACRGHHNSYGEAKK